MYEFLNSGPGLVITILVLGVGGVVIVNLMIGRARKAAHESQSPKPQEPSNPTTPAKPKASGFAWPSKKAVITVGEEVFYLKNHRSRRPVARKATVTGFKTSWLHGVLVTLEDNLGNRFSVAESRVIA